MSAPWFKRGASKIERPFVMPNAGVGHVIFGVLLAIVFINIRMAAMRNGIDSLFLMGLFLFVSLVITASLLNFAPAKYIRDEANPE